MSRGSYHPPPEQLALPFAVEPSSKRPREADPTNAAPPSQPAFTVSVGQSDASTTPSGPLRVSQIVPVYLEFCAAIDRAPHTLRTIDLDLALLARFLEDRPVQAVSLDDLRHFSLWLRAERHNDSRSLRRKVASVKAFFAYVKERGIRSDDPSEALIYPAAEPHLPEFLESGEVQRLVDATERLLWRALIVTLLETGLKRDEVLALHPSDVFLDPDQAEHSYLVVRAANQARRIRVRTLPLPLRARDVLSQYSSTVVGDRLFPISVRAVNLIVETSGERAGLHKRGPISPQMLRDTFAVQEVRRRLEAEAASLQQGVSDGALAVLQERHDREVCELLGLATDGTNDPIARYRVLAAAGRHWPRDLGRS
ncbi:MAG TPA: site-specific integrase [Chloroflexota bacterium]|nr:site-specific integrase [Chloroflexota bacterium]